MKKWFTNIWARNAWFMAFVLFLAAIADSSASYSWLSLEKFMMYLSYVVDYAWIFVHNKILIERFFLKRKIRSYMLLLLASYTLYLPFYYLFNGGTLSPGTILTAVLNLSAIKLLGIGLYALVRYILDRDRYYKASISARDLEMELLKSQLNPHFLFNALNNIYSHLLTGNKGGQELVLRLSELMRYVLDSSKKKQVNLAEEMKFIENFMAFEKERLGERCEINYQKELQNENLKIAPLILFTFIENAFKHGTQSIQRSVINLEIRERDRTLNLKISNPLSQHNSDSTRIGLQNTTRRLELLYPDTHALRISQQDNKYTVSFQLNNLK